jgi:D-alanyl-D-alanine carboxypeptidase
VPVQSAKSTPPLETTNPVETQHADVKQAETKQADQVETSQIEAKPAVEVKQVSEPAAAPQLVKVDSKPKQTETPVKEMAASEDATAKDSVSVTASVTETIAKARTGWMIQIGAFDDEKEAKQRLLSAKTKAKTLLSNADPFTERVRKGEKALYRARFAGLRKGQAQTACKHLKRNEIPCIMLKN